MVNLYPGNVQLNIIVPLGHDKTLTIFEWHHTEPGDPESWNDLQDAIAFSDQVQKEDIELCEDVWRNLQTGIYDTGRFSVKRENGVHHFQGLLADFLSRQ
jgi:choline monooxygenase